MTKVNLCQSDEVKFKVILNPAIARKLLQLGNTILDIKPNKNNKAETVFIFEDTEKLRDDMSLV
jgi:hypothetical protein